MTFQCHPNLRRNLRGYGAESTPPTLIICHFVGEKLKGNFLCKAAVFAGQLSLQGNLLDPGPFDGLLLMKRKVKGKIFEG